MKRTNTFEVRPRSESDEALLQGVIDATASFWNELTYACRQRFFDDESIWETDEFRGQYKGQLGAVGVQTVTRKNNAAWNSFFALLERGEDASPPGYWENTDDGRDLRVFVRNDSYEIQWGEYSRVEVPVGQDLKDKYNMGYFERLRLEVRGDPKWSGEQGELEIQYDEVEDTYRAYQPVTIDESELDSPLASEEAALDLGVNNLVACTTTTGEQYLYDGEELFEQFRATTEEIGRLKSKLPPEQDTSRQIRRLYRKRSRRRSHAQKALARDLVERLHDEGIATVYIGDLTGVMEPQPSPEINEKLNHFWAVTQFIDQLRSVCGEYGIQVQEKSETWTSQACPDCGEQAETVRHRETLACSCGLDGHADLTAAETLLRWNTDQQVRPMARPVRFQWDNYEWR
ncbi:RNA-guided endonuclease InsQ/TnpB family protein [Halobellus ruber]|uniref:Transposase n=1 Tax=Halobellus ruber TaxID=2761102 RepID=A0A7J9SFI6_9EURY|nr:transposase [Halobellus ruber]